MDPLPDEILLHIVSFLEPNTIAKLQAVSRRLHAISRDHTLWKTICFRHSRVELQRRRQQLLSAQDPGLVALREALPSVADHAPSVQMLAYNTALRESKRILANWDPSYPGENINFYQEYVQRNAPVTLTWLQSPFLQSSPQRRVGEALGMGVVESSQNTMADKIIAPMDDGSVCVWDIREESHSQGGLIAQSHPGLLTGQSGRNGTIVSIAQDLEATDTVSVDKCQKRAYIGVHNDLIELDLETLQVLRTSAYPFLITALSEANHPTPITVGTHSSLFHHDWRSPSTFPRESERPVRCELIGGTPPPNNFHRLMYNSHRGIHAPLAEPGPLSILHLPSYTSNWNGNGDIWVAGRFKSLLNYDRRFWPRLCGTLHSGARLSCISSMPYPYISRELDLMKRRDLSLQDLSQAKGAPGRTIVAVGEYKGKGSLELYGLSPDPTSATLSTNGRVERQRQSFYQNRQTASASRLLSTCFHGTRIVFSDGNGNLKWMERDGKTEVRSFNINHEAPDQERTLFQPSGRPEANGDIVQKIVPTNGSLGGTINRDNLVVRTGDGQIGVVGFGIKPAFGSRDLQEDAAFAEDEVKMEEERSYGQNMRRALERQADEVRALRGLGLAVGR